MRGWLTSWRLALRLARRDLLKHKARAIIALVMVTLPVLGVVAADVLIQTARVSPAEGIDRRIGTAATAEIRYGDGNRKVAQSADPQTDAGTLGKLARPTTLADIEGVIGKRTMLPAPAHKDLLVRTAHGREDVRAAELQLTAPLATGLYRLTSGRWPRTTGEVVVNQAMRDRGAGSTLAVVDRDRTETQRTVVGTVVDATERSVPVVVGLPGAFPAAPAYSTWDASKRAWLVDGPPITWTQVQRLNALGVYVTDRQIASHPGDYPDPFPDSGIGDTTIQVGALIVVMALIEVVLLAGPAFAVGARKQQRSLALLVSAGGTPGQARRVIIAGGLLLGLAAGVVGVLSGIGLGWLLQPAVQRFDGEWLGPFDVPWLHLLAVAAFGLVSALIACLVPAWIASRQNVVAVLAGRRGDAKPVRAFPVAGVVLFGIGVLMAVWGSRGYGTLTVAWSAVVCVLGMVLLVPAVVSWVARAAGRFPLSVRFAARDAVRHRTRTTPAVAAVAATVAGVVALGIGNASDEKQNRETYQPQLVMGDALVTPSYDFVGSGPSAATDWSKVSAVVRQQVPGARITPVVGLQESQPSGAFTTVIFGPPRGGDQIITTGTEGLGTDVLVSDGSQLPPTMQAALPQGSAVRSALAAGKAVVFTDDAAQGRLAAVRIAVSSTSPRGQVTAGIKVTVPAYVVPIGAREAGPPVEAILPPALADRIGVGATTVGLELARPHLSTTAEQNLDDALEGLATPASVTVERGYQAEAYTRIVQWVLAVLAAMLMLGGTLTAMFLALSDARPDLATLAAVGAEPKTRRSVAAAYTFVVAFVGAVLGMVVGFVPGLAITRPLTRIDGPGQAVYFVDVPWLLIAVVVIGLPLLTAAIVGACTRSRLPMVARLT